MSNFDKAFAKARKSGLKAFSFGGKSYNTKLAKEPAAKKSSLPKTAPTPSSRNNAISEMSKGPSFSSLTEAGKSPAKKTSDAPFFPVTTSTNRSQLNDFRQSESRRASDEATGYANRPKVKRAIGKFMIGKAYKD